jgi:hypothetical protein
MTRLHRTVLMTLVALSAVAAAAVAQPPHVHFQKFEVAIWPEYDQPAALVMYRGWLAPDVQLPITVSLPVPASVAAPSAAAKRGPGTNLLMASYTVENRGEWNIVHLQTELPEVRIEFYLDLATDQPQRAFTFEWPGGPVIDETTYEIMQPLGATDFKASPSSALPALGQDGLTYQREELGPIAEGAPFYIQFSYTKNTPDLTASALQPVDPPQQQAPPPQNAAPATQQQGAPTQESSDDSVWFIVIPIVFAAGLAAGWILLSSRKEKGS